MSNETIEIEVTTEDLSRLGEILTRREWDSQQFLSEAIKVLGARDRAERFAAIARKGQESTRAKYGRDLTPEEIAAKTREAIKG